MSNLNILHSCIKEKDLEFFKENFNKSMFKDDLNINKFLVLCSKWDSDSIAKYLYTFLNGVSMYDLDIIYKAIEYLNLDVFKVHIDNCRLLKKDLSDENQNKFYFDFIIHSIATDSLKGIKYIFTKNYDPNTKDGQKYRGHFNNPIRKCIEYLRYDILKYLLDKKVYYDKNSLADFLNKFFLGKSLEIRENLLSILIDKNPSILSLLDKKILEKITKYEHLEKSDKYGLFEKKIKNFNQFLNENIKFNLSLYDDKGDKILPGEDIKKINMISSTNTDIYFNIIDDKNKEAPTKNINKIYCDLMFNMIDKWNWKSKKIDISLPTIDMSIILDNIRNDLYDKYNIDKNKILNKFENKVLSKNKLEFHKILKDKYYIPKTEFTPENAIKRLNFPIVVKPIEGSTGKGITKLETKDDLNDFKKYWKNWGIFSEAIQIRKEYRIIFFNDDILLFATRIPKSKKSRFMHGKLEIDVKKINPKNSIDFLYYFHTEDKIYTMEKGLEILEICNDLKNSIKLEYLAIDLAIDKNGKIWVIECNSNPVPQLNTLVKLYESIYKYRYNEDLSEETSFFLKKISQQCILNAIKFPQMYRVSKFLIKKYFE